ncbi:unnamed protein product [Closterium sp. NIES-65]|nr:unnamed protein product [Closterium sp. NIES-65]
MIQNPAALLPLTPAPHLPPARSATTSQQAIPSHPTFATNIRCASARRDPLRANKYPRLASPRLLPLSIAHRTRHATQCQPKANLQTSLSLPLALAHSATPSTPPPPSPSYPPSPLFLPGQRKASSKRGEGSRREEAMGAPRAGSRAAVSASSTVEVASIAPATTLHKGPTPPQFSFTLRPLAAYSPALRVCLAGGGEGCGVSIAIPSRLSPVAVQGGTHTGRLGGGLPGKESPGAAAAALCSLSRLTAKFPQPLACLAMSCTPSGAGVQVPPQVQPLGLQFVTWPPPVAPPLSRLANAVPSLALSPFIPSLPTDQLFVCALQVEGRGGGQHWRFPTLLPCGRAGTCGDGREATLPVTAARESIGVGLASQVLAGLAARSSSAASPSLPSFVSAATAALFEAPQELFLGRLLLFVLMRPRNIHTSSSCFIPSCHIPSFPPFSPFPSFPFILLFSLAVQRPSSTPSSPFPPSPAPSGSLRAYLSQLAAAADVPTFVCSNPLGLPAVRVAHLHDLLLLLRPPSPPAHASAAPARGASHRASAPSHAAAAAAAVGASGKGGGGFGGDAARQKRKKKQKKKQKKKKQKKQKEALAQQQGGEKEGGEDESMHGSSALGGSASLNQHVGGGEGGVVEETARRKVEVSEGEEEDEGEEDDEEEEEGEEGDEEDGEEEEEETGDGAEGVENAAGAGAASVPVQVP